MEKQWKQWQTLFLGVPKSLQMVTAAMKLKDAYSLVGKVMSLLLNMLSRLVITFLPRSKRLFNFLAAVTICSDFGAQKI